MKFKALSILIISTVFALPACGKEHEHIPNESWSHDSFYHWHDCTGCDEQLAKAAHNFTDWKITKEPTCSDDGLMERTCKTCDYKVEEVIPKLGHKYQDIRVYDETNHWHECARDKTHISEYEEHTFEETILKEPTCEEDGIKLKTCKCGYNFKETIPAIKHKFSPKNIGEITLNAENPTKVEVFCENNKAHKLEFSLPSINSKSYEPLATYHGNCLVESTTTCYKLKETEKIRESFKAFTNKISNPDDFYNYIFSSELNIKTNQVLDKHFKLVGYEIRQEPTFNDIGYLDLICECGEKISKILRPLTFCFYDVIYHTDKSPKTVFNLNGIDITYECEENFIHYEKILNDLKTKQFVFEMPGIPRLDMIDKDFETGNTAQILFKYDGQPYAYKVPYANFNTEKNKFIEKLVLEDNPNDIGKIAKKEIYLKYEHVLEAVKDLSGVKNHPNLEEFIETTPYYVFGNQNRNDIEYLLPEHTFKDFEIVKPTLETSGTLTINSTETYNEIYILPKLNSYYYLKTTTTSGDEYYLEEEAITKLLEFSIFNSNQNLINELKKINFK